MKVEIKRWEWIVLVILFIAGFLLGRLTIRENAGETEVREKITYVPAPYEIRDTIKEPVPYLEYITKVDTFFIPVKEPGVIDTLKVIEDYFLTRHYKLDFSADTIGTFIVDTEIHQNRLVAASSEIRPIIRTVEREKVVYEARAMQFYGMLGTSVNLSTQKLSFGVDLKQRYLIGVSGVRLDNNYNYTIDFGIKF